MDPIRLSRRDVVRMASFSLAPLALPGWRPRLAFALPGNAPIGDVMVCVFLRGGMDGLNAVIPHAEDAYYDARPTLAIPAPKPGDDSAAVELTDRFSLHPALRPLKDPYDAGSLAIIHAAGSPDPTHSHFDAMDYMERGTPGEKQIPSGWIARHLQTAAWENDSPFRAVAIGGVTPASLRGPIPAAALRSIADFHLPGNPQGVTLIQETLSSLYASTPQDPLFESLATQSDTTMEAMETLAGLDAASYETENGAVYPEDEFGLALSQVALLVKSELGLEVACIDLGGWDTHVAQGADAGPMPTLLGSLAAGLAAFDQDLGQRMNGVTVVVMSEFGRRLQENGGAGTDHGHGNVMFVMGGGIHGGKVYGEWPGLEAGQLYGPGDLAITTDFRNVLAEVVLRRLGNERLEEIFPGYDSFSFLELAEERPV